MPLTKIGPMGLGWPVSQSQFATRLSHGLQDCGGDLVAKGATGGPGLEFLNGTVGQADNLVADGAADVRADDDVGQAP